MWNTYTYCTCGVAGVAIFLLSLVKPLPLLLPGWHGHWAVAAPFFSEISSSLKKPGVVVPSMSAPVFCPSSRSVDTKSPMRLWDSLRHAGQIQVLFRNLTAGHQRSRPLSHLWRWGHHDSAGHPGTASDQLRGWEFVERCWGTNKNNTGWWWVLTILKNMKVNGKDYPI